MRDLDGLDLVMFREGYDLRAVTLAACADAGVEPHLVSEGGEMAGVLSFVAAGLGAAVVPAIALPGDRSLVAVPFSGPTMSRTVALAQRGDRTLARPARALADQLVTRRAATVGNRAGRGRPAGGRRKPRQPPSAPAIHPSFPRVGALVHKRTV